MARSRSKKPRYSSPARAATLEISQPQANWSGYQAAWHTTDRGYIQWPTIEARQELDAFSRYEILRRIHFLYGNFGFLRGVIRSIAKLVGSETPQANSGDPTWDTAAEAYFHDVCGEAAAFDVSGKFDFYESQPMLVRAALKDSQVFIVLTKWQDGNPRVAFYEAAQLASPPKVGEDWVDGIQIAPKTRRHIAYGFRDAGTDNVIVIPARSVIHFGEFDSPGEDMPVPPFAHAVNHALDITEVWGFVKKAIKNASLTGTVIEREGSALPPRARQGIVGVQTSTISASGEKFTHENVMDGGQIPRLDAGEKMKVLEDRRPSPEQRQLILDLKRDICQGAEMPLEIFDDMGNLTGPGIRFVMDFAGNTIIQRRKRLRTMARRLWRYVIACGIANGRLSLPVPAENAPQKGWWNVSFTSQRLLTVDRGRDSKSRLDELDRGVSTLASFEEFDGMNWQERGEQRIREVAWLTEQCEAAGLTYEQVFPPRQGAAAPAAAEKIDTATPEEDPEAP